MKVLWVTGSLPYPPVTGGKIRVWNLLQQVTQIHDITLVSLLDSPDDMKFLPHLRRYCSVHTVVKQRKRPRGKLLFGLLQTMLKGQPPRNCIAYYEELKHKVYEITSRQPFDIVHIEQSQMAPYVEFVSSSYTPARLVTLYDAGAAQYDRIRRIQAGLSSARVLTLLDWIFLRHWESTYLARQFDRCIVVSPADQALLRQASPHLQLTVVPNGVDTVLYQRLPRPGNSKEILFIGKMNYPPNVDGVLFFYNEVFPLVRRQVPEARLLIVGAEPSAEVQALGNDPTVRMIGQVEDVVPYYRRAYLSVVTLRAGGGTRLKILEAMALGRPVVSTMLGCEGLGVLPGENILVADTPQGLAAHMIRLFNDKDEYNRLVDNGRRLVESRYDWRITAQSLLRVYDQIALAKKPVQELESNILP